jgi:nitrous oxide reductase accessory protein NosL
MKKYAVILLLVIIFGIPNGVYSQPKEIESHKECPLCNMYPARYPRFNCQIVFNDGSYEAFDTSIGLILYQLFPEKTGIKPKPVSRIYFKNYLETSWLEADKAFFVVGSDIRGPMGVQFLPVDGRQSAEALKKQVNGKDIIHFKEISRQYMIKAAKAGWLHKMAKKMVLK